MRDGARVFRGSSHGPMSVALCPLPLPAIFLLLACDSSSDAHFWYPDLGVHHRRLFGGIAMAVLGAAVPGYGWGPA